VIRGILGRIERLERTIGADESPVAVVEYEGDGRLRRAWLMRAADGWRGHELLPGPPPDGRVGVSLPEGTRVCRRSAA